MGDYDNLKSSGQLDEIYGGLKSTSEIIELTKGSSSISKEQYERLAERFEKAMQLIEAQRTKITELESNKMPSKDDVESMSAMLDLIGKLDEKSINRLNRLGKMNSNG